MRPNPATTIDICVRWVHDPPMASHQRTLTALGVTFARLPLAAGLCLSYLGGRLALSTLALALFVALDEADGVLDRSADRGESSLRRISDAVIDRLGVAAFFAVAGFSQHVLWCVPVAVLAANLALAPGAILGIRRGFIMKAPRWHRCWTGGSAIAALMLLIGAPPPDVAIGVLMSSVLIALTAVDFLRRQYKHLGNNVRLMPTVSIAFLDLPVVTV